MAGKRERKSGGYSPIRLIRHTLPVRIDHCLPHLIYSHLSSISLISRSFFGSHRSLYSLAMRFGFPDSRSSYLFCYDVPVVFCNSILSEIRRSISKYIFSYWFVRFVRHSLSRVFAIGNPGLSFTLSLSLPLLYSLSH